MIKEVCNSETEIFPYIARVPKNFKENLPIIFLLHGAGERGNGSDEQINRVEIHGFCHMFTDDADIDCILVQPQCPDNDFWVAHIQEIKLFIEEVTAKYKADADRVYLTGLSMGGYGTWFTAMAFPGMFAAIAPVCGGGMPWFSDALKMPVWAWHGDVDNVVLPSNSIDMVEAMQRWGKKNLKFSLIENCGHGVWEYAYKPELLEWLLEQKRGN